MLTIFKSMSVPRIEQIDTGVSFKTRQMKCDARLPGVPSMLGDRSGHQSMFCGPSGSGKTSLMMAMLTNKHLFRKVFDTILIFMPPSSRASLPNKMLESLEYPPFDQLDAGTLDQAMDIIESNSDQDPPLNTLVIFDDVTAALKDHSTLKGLTHLSFARRHLRCSIWMLTQTLVSVPLNLRKNFTHLFLFRPRNFKEITHLFEEYTASRSEAEALIAAVWHEPHDVLLLHTESGSKWRISGNRVLELRMDQR